MKTPKDITELNYNYISFLFNISTTEAKFKVLLAQGIELNNIEKHLNEKTGIPLVTKKDRIPKHSVEIKMKSYSSMFDGKNHIDCHIAMYNKGICLTKLKSYAENDSFIKALKFTGKYEILNEILNSKQLLKLQRTWVTRNTYNVIRWSKKCIQFIENNDWCIDYLSEKFPFKEQFEKQKEIIRMKI